MTYQVVPGEMIKGLGTNASKQQLRNHQIRLFGTYAQIQKKYFGDQDIYNE
mgnify:CR=1 FL=1